MIGGWTSLDVRSHSGVDMYWLLGVSMIEILRASKHEYWMLDVHKQRDVSKKSDPEGNQLWPFCSSHPSFCLFSIDLYIPIWVCFLTTELPDIQTAQHGPRLQFEAYHPSKWRGWTVASRLLFYPLAISLFFLKGKSRNITPCMDDFPSYKPAFRPQNPSGKSSQTEDPNVHVPRLFIWGNYGKLMDCGGKMMEYCDKLW